MGAFRIDLAEIKIFCEFALRSLFLFDFYSNFVCHEI